MNLRLEGLIKEASPRLRRQAEIKRKSNQMSLKEKEAVLADVEQRLRDTTHLKEEGIQYQLRSVRRLLGVEDLR